MEIDLGLGEPVDVGTSHARDDSRRAIELLSDDEQAAELDADELRRLLDERAADGLRCVRTDGAVESSVTAASSRSSSVVRASATRILSSPLTRPSRAMRAKNSRAGKSATTNTANDTQR